MAAVSARQIIVATSDPSRLAWLVTALRDAGHAVFPVSDGEGVVTIAHILSEVDLLIASRDTPTHSGVPFDRLIQDRLPNVSVLYWDPDEQTSPRELETLLSP